MFFNTGLEYRATLEHLDFLEKKYGITIKRVRPKKPILLAVKQYGVPFRSKFTSKNLGRLQSLGFKWEDKPYEELVKQYPKTYMQWWCNYRIEGTNEYVIDRNPYLRDFIMQNPPPFKISDKCCYYAKKQPGHRLDVEGGYDLKCMGVRRNEGGIRAMSYTNCFSEGNNLDNFRPVWYFSNADKEEYCRHYGVTHSRCYTEYGFKRTGCAGCPFSPQVLEDLEIIQKYEPQLYKACVNIFGESYDYTRRYRAFREEMKQREKTMKGGEHNGKDTGNTESVPEAREDP